MLRPRRHGSTGPPRITARPAGLVARDLIDAIPHVIGGLRVTAPSRWAWAEIDLDALAHNVGVMRRRWRRPRFGPW